MEDHTVAEEVRWWWHCCWLLAAGFRGLPAQHALLLPPLPGRLRGRRREQHHQGVPGRRAAAAGLLGVAGARTQAWQARAPCALACGRAFAGRRGRQGLCQCPQPASRLLCTRGWRRVRPRVQVSQWTSVCLESCIKKLAGLNKPFKYVVTCIIMQKSGAWVGRTGLRKPACHQQAHTCSLAPACAPAGAGLHTAASCWWDNTTDGSRTVKFENKSMYCIMTVFGLAI